VLIGEDWTIWRIDFSRDFLTSKDLRELLGRVSAHGEL
jgi:hypothetical protein